MIFNDHNCRGLEYHSRGWFLFPVLLSFVGIALVLSFGAYAETNSKDVNQIDIWVSHCAVLDFDQAISKVFVADPEIADVAVTTPKHVLVTGKEKGNTRVVVWIDEKKYEQFDVAVTEKQEPVKNQVMLQVRFAEMTRDAIKELGAHFIIEQLKVGSEELTAASFAGRVNTPSIPPIVDDNVSFFFSVPTQNLSSVIRALEEKRVLTTLAEPNLVAASGEEASFLAGGEFPVPVVQGVAGMQSITIIFKEFGVRLAFTPTILDSNRIKLEVEPEVSSLDFENGIVLSGFHIPSLLTRKTNTTVQLKDGEGLVIGGLITNELVETISRIPVLGHVPILGRLFSSKRMNNAESELIILIVPRIIRPMAPDAIKDVRLSK